MTPGKDCQSHPWSRGRQEVGGLTPTKTFLKDIFSVTQSSLFRATSSDPRGPPPVSSWKIICSVPWGRGVERLEAQRQRRTFSRCLLLQL